MQAAQPDNNGPSTDHGLPTALFVLPPSQQQKRVETASATRLQQTPVNYNYSRQQHVVHPQQHLPRPVTTTGHASTASQFSVATTPGNHPPLVSGTSLESQRVPHQRVLPRTAPALAHTVGRGGVILSDASSAVGTQKRALIHSVDRRPSSAIVNSRSISVPVQLPVVVVQERRTANIARYQPALPVTADQQIADVSTSTSLPSTTATNQALSHQPNRSPVPAMMRMMHTPSTILRLHSTSSASSVKNVDFQQLAAPQSLLKETSTTARRLDNTRGGFAGQTANDAIICSNFGQLTDKVSTPLCSQPPHTVVNRSTLTNAKKRKDVARPKKTASGLFSSMNASMLAMFDDDDEENDAPFAFVSRAKQPIIAEEKDPPFHRSIAAPLFTGSSCCKEQDPAIVLANTTASNASLFQSAAFTGLDVDDMFDEDDD